MSAKRRRKRGFAGRLLVGVLAASVRHGRRHAKRAATAAGRATGPKVIRRASEEYDGKRRAGTPIPVRPVNPSEAQSAPVWEFEAQVGNHPVVFTLVADTSITALDETEMITYALLAACHQTHSQRPLDESWPVTWIAAISDAAREHFGDAGYHLVPGMDRR